MVYDVGQCDTCLLASIVFTVFGSVVLHNRVVYALEMSDSESNGSRTESEESTDHEDVAEQSSVVQPYMFEPDATSDYEENQTDEDGILRETLEARFHKTVAITSW